MSAGEPEEVDAYQEIFDELINAETDYNVEIESVGRLRGAVPDPGRGRHPRRGRRAQPGAIPRWSTRARSSSLEDMGFDIEELNAQLGESFMALGEYEGEHYGLPTNINLKSMVWYPKDDFDAAGYEVPETWDDLIALSDQIVADGSTPGASGFGAGLDRMAGHRLDGGHHAPHRAARRLRPVGQRTRSRSTTRPS